MKIGTCVSMRGFENLPQKLEKLRENGFDNCQLIAWQPELWTEENAQLLNGWLKQYEITVSAFWCGWEGPCVWDFYKGPLTLGLVPPEYRQMRIKNLCDGADFAKKLGVKNVVTHMGYIPEDPNDTRFAGLCEAIGQVARHLAKNGQDLLFETGQETPVTMLRCIETVGAANLGVNLDTANLIMYGKANPVDALDVFGHLVRNLHAKDGCYPTNGKELGIETRIGEGKVDFRRLFEKLHQLGYTGYVTIEREIEGPQQAKDILAARDYLQAFIDDVYGG